MKSIIISETKGMFQIKPRIGQGRAGLRQKIKSLMSQPINKPIVKLSENPIEHLEVTLKVTIPECSSIHDKLLQCQVTQFLKQDRMKIQVLD